MPDRDPAALVTFLRSLCAVREFRPNPIPQQVVADILEVGRWSGSAVNRQPWEFVVVRDRAMLDALAEVEGSAGHLAGAPLGIVLVMAGKNATQETYDEGRLSERMMLAASAHGVGSSIGWFRSCGSDRAKELLGVPAERTVRTALSFGYPDAAARAAKAKRDQARKLLVELVHEERYA